MLTVPRLLVLACALAGAGCLRLTPDTFVMSDPTGARVAVDGRDSGWVTPCQIDLERDVPHTIAVSLPGYAVREFVIVPERHMSMVTWPLGANGMSSTARFPFLLPFVDLFFPLREKEFLAPGRLWVRLRPVAEPEEPLPAEPAPDAPAPAEPAEASP